MGRRSKSHALGVWMNGEPVGRWVINSRGEHSFRYDPAWEASEYGRAVSLSMPLHAAHIFRGEVVKNYFDNLLPDNDKIRARIQQRFSLKNAAPFDLLAEIGRDCVGAIQLLPDGESPGSIQKIEADPLSETDIEQILINTTVLGQDQDDDDFRISLAGAQEKTALLYRDGGWLRPRGATPTTHILKLPIGRHSENGIDLTTSVENEWLCAQILDAFGIPVAPCWPATFGEKTVLVVERFDRRLSRDGGGYLRLPQEDMCQATGIPPSARYEKDGGPGIPLIMNLLLGSTHAEADRKTFFKTQVIFWLLAAIDGHAKNFSLFLDAGGGYRLTPSYDVLSAYPVMGKGARMLQEKKIKMAMALIGQNRHYRWHELQRRHLEFTANKCGLGEAGKAIIDELVTQTPHVAAKVAAALPAGFPDQVAEPVLGRLQATADKL